MNTSDFENFKQRLESFDKMDSFSTSEFDLGDYKSEIKNLIKESASYKKRSVLGIDIYHYSQYPLDKQTLIPFAFDLINHAAIRLAKDGEPWLYLGYDFEKNFIPTGDGGFQIFDDPIQALVFNCQFYVALRSFNSFHYYPKLRKAVGIIELRSCLTRDKLFSYGNNHYGPAIISNSRILSRDKLNRFLIDERTHRWFLKKLNGIEMMSRISFEKLMGLYQISAPVINSVLFRNQNFVSRHRQDPKMSKILSLSCQKVGDLQVKGSPFSVHNVEIQLYSNLIDESDNTKSESMVVTIGNSNSSGISD